LLVKVQTVIAPNIDQQNIDVKPGVIVMITGAKATNLSGVLPVSLAVEMAKDTSFLPGHYAPNFS
jgi:hypothetical protein